MTVRSSLMGLSLAATLISSPALARPQIVVLAFGGDQGTEVRDVIVAALAKRYEVVHGQKLLDACDQLGITMSRGKNLATAAAHLGAVAVVGGTIKGGRLALAVYSGKTGQPLAMGPVAFSGHITRPMLAQALTLILKGLHKAPKRVARTGAVPEPSAPKPELRPPRETGAGSGGGGGGGGGARSGSGGSDGGSVGARGSLTYDPNAPDTPAGSAAAAAGSGAEENPLAPVKPAPAAPPPTVQATPAGPRPTRVQALVGLGSWIRNFDMNDAADPIGAPNYHAAAFTLRFDVRLYPVALFLENWPAGFIIHFQYQQALGLSSVSPQKDDGSTGSTVVNKSFGTSMRQLLFDVGYDWKMLPSALSPHLELKMGFGMMDFAIDWDQSATHNLPAASYRFFLADLEFRYEFLSWLGAQAGFDYRAVSGTGEIEDDATWYGSSSTGGINLSMGVHSQWKGITATAEYAYTRYFYSFTDPTARQSAGKRAAGGALDQLHTLMLSGGYAF